MGVGVDEKKIQAEGNHRIVVTITQCVANDLSVKRPRHTSSSTKLFPHSLSLPRSLDLFSFPLSQLPSLTRPTEGKCSLSCISSIRSPFACLPGSFRLARLTS